MSVRITITLLALGALTGCGGLRGEAPDQLYVLRAVETTAGAPAVSGVLSVLRPALQPGLETDRIALVRAGNELDYYAASRWSESLPRVVSALTVQAFGGAGGFATVVDAGRAAVRSDFELLLTVRHFEADYTAGGTAPVARVAFDCVLTAGVPRRVLGRCDAEERQPVGENRMAPLVAALEQAAQRALTAARAQAVALAAAEVRR